MRPGVSSQPREPRPACVVAADLHHYDSEGAGRQEPLGRAGRARSRRNVDNNQGVKVNAGGGEIGGKDVGSGLLNPRRRLAVGLEGGDDVRGDARSTVAGDLGHSTGRRELGQRADSMRLCSIQKHGGKSI